MNEDSLLRMLYRRFRIDDYKVETDWTAFEQESGRVLRGRPSLYIDLTHSYPHSVDDCPRHRFPLGISDMLSVVYDNEPHLSCVSCGLILTLPGGHTWDRL